MAVYRRRKAKKKNPTKKRVSAKRRAAGKKGARTAKRNKAKRSASAKKGRSKAKRRANPVRRRKRTSVKRRPKRRVAKRRNPRRRKASTKRRTVKRRRRNPPTGTQRKGLQYHAQLKAQAAALGLSTKGKTATLEGRLSKAGRKPRKRKAKVRKKLSKHQTYARRYRKSTTKHKIRRGKNKGKVVRRSSGAARVSKAYLKTQRLQRGIARGKVAPGAAKMALAMGLTRVNPAGGVLKDFVNTAKALAIPAVITVSGMYGMAWIGLRASAAIVKAAGDMLPAPIAKNIVPITTFTVSLAAAMGLRRLITKKLPLIKMDGAQLAPWVAVGGLGATLLMVMATTEWGKKLTAKMGLTFSIDTAAASQAAAEGSNAAAKGLEGYITVSQYLGAYGVEIDPMGASWYGRGDISALGDYVDAGPQNMFGNYMASSFPVHSPGPGDNINVMATLGDYDHADEYGQEGVFAGSHPPGGYGELDLEETPGGTVITGSMGEAGIFGGKGVL